VGELPVGRERRFRAGRAAAGIGGHFPEASFDLITGRMSFQDIADPAAVLAGAGRLLRPGGRVVFSIPHPCTDTLVRRGRRNDAGRKAVLELDRSFDTGPAVCDWSMARPKCPWRTPYRRFTLAEWVGLVRAAGLVVLGMTEPRPNAALPAANPDSEDCARMAYFLVCEAGRLREWLSHACPAGRTGSFC
jgi:SAM-dependent methyltransferase